MQKIVITNPTFFKGEIPQLRHILSDKNVCLHLRKPEASQAEYEAFLQAIPAEFYPRIVLHDYYFLQGKYNIGSIHFSTKNRTTLTVNHLPLTTKKSTSCHSIEELQDIDGQFDYAFLSPIFPSISKPEYVGNLDINEVSDFLQKPHKTKIIALGGIDDSKISQIAKWGFDGYAMLGAAWEIPASLEEMGGRLQYITQDNPDLTHAEQAKLMYENGVRWVQIRMKSAPREAIVKEARKALQYARELGGTLIINDHVDICREIGAHGVHLGLTDTSVAEARRKLGSSFIIGGTANTTDAIALHAYNGADYVGLGPFRFTTTKKNLSPIIGTDGYTKLMQDMPEQNLEIPVVAVGGIEIEDFQALREIGLFGVAISTSLLEKYAKIWKV